jgi:AraC-like DNA-binding protein
MQTWVLIYAIGAAQAVLLALALWRRPANAHANRVLAAWTGVVALDLAVKAAYLAAPSADLFKAYRFVGLFPFLYAPFFHVYVRTLTTGRALGMRDTVHLAGFALGLALSARLFLLDAGATARLHARYLADTWPGPAGWYDLVLFAYAFAYIGAALACIARYRRQLRRQRSDADRQSMRWLGALAFGQLVIWLIAGSQMLVDLPWLDYYLIYGAVAAWVFVIGYFSLAQPPVVDLPGDAPPVAEAPAAAVDRDNDDARFPEVEARLSRLMADDALYREPALTVAQLARRSGYPEYLVSAVINRRCGGNFWEYVNRHRVEAVRACLVDRGDGRTILDIAYACGFTSKSTFNAAFKREVGETPSAYRQRHAVDDARDRDSAAKTPPA